MFCGSCLLTSWFLDHELLAWASGLVRKYPKQRVNFFNLKESYTWCPACITEKLAFCVAY